MLDFVVYLLYRAGSAIAAALPLRLLFATGQILGSCAWLVSGKYRRLAERNVGIAFGDEKSPRELRRLVHRHFRRLGANLLCSVKLTQMSPKQILQRVTVENIESMDRRFRAGIPASTSPLAGLLAKRTRAAVIAAAVYTTGPARWRMVFTERFDQPGASIADLTSKINKVIEQQIRVAPDDWFWVHNRWKTPQPNFLLARYKRGVYLPPGVSAHELKPFRILVRSSNWLGDAVMSVPALRAIKDGRPDAQVTIATPSNIAPIWKLVPGVDAIIPLPNGSLLSAVGLLRRRSHFDAV